MEFSESIIGKSIGNYEIQRELGRGGMGYVYKAHEQSLQRVVALKVLPPHLASSPQFVKRFEREARSAARLSHPNIVTVFAVGSEGDYHFIAMEYVKGETVDQIVRERGKMDPREAVDVIQQVADALAEAHRNDIIHRDIKPQNIMIDQSGRVKVMDFGLAKVMSGGSELTSAGTYLGTPTYMSPEQCQGKDLDSRTDIYSLGIMFYEMVTGTLPFTADTPLAVMRKIIDEPMPALTRSVTGVPSDIEYIIEKMAAKNPSARYSSAEDLSADLKAWLRGDKTSLSAEATIPTPKGVRVPAPKADATIVSSAKALSDPEGVLAAPAASSVAVTSAFSTPPEGVAEAPPNRAGGGMAALTVATVTFLVLVGVFGGAVYFLYGQTDPAPAERVEGTSPAPAVAAPVAETEPPVSAPSPEPAAGEAEPEDEEEMAAGEVEVTPADGIDTVPVTEAEVADAAEAAETARAKFAERSDEVDGAILEAADDAFENGRAYRQLGAFTEALAAYNTAAEQYGALYESLPAVMAEPAPAPEPEAEPAPAMAVRANDPAPAAPAVEAAKPPAPEPAEEEMARETPPPASRPAAEEAVKAPAPEPARSAATTTPPAPKPAPAPVPAAAAPAPEPAPSNPPMTAEAPTEEAPPAQPAAEAAPPAAETSPPVPPPEEPARPSATEKKPRPAGPRHLRP